MGGYYSTDEIRKQKDLRGNSPRVFYIVGNRTSGKTTSVLMDCLEEAAKPESVENSTERFVLVYRTMYEQEGVGGMFEDAVQIMQENSRLPEDAEGKIELVKCLKGLWHEILLDSKVVGYTISLGSVDKIKKYSAYFRGVKRFFFDEFITESGSYLKNEPSKLISVIMSMSRGGGDRMRDVELWMVANNITLINPYFSGLNVYGRIRENTHFLRGDGWIIEFAWDENATNEVEQNTLIRAFSGLCGNYVDYIKGKSFMVNDGAFIETGSGRSHYICTLVYGDRSYAVRDFYEQGYYHIGTHTDPSCPYVYALRAGDHDQNRSMLSHATSIWRGIVETFEKGRLRFENAECKSVIYTLLGVDLYG